MRYLSYGENDSTHTVKWVWSWCPTKDIIRSCKALISIRQGLKLIHTEQEKGLWHLQHFLLLFQPFKLAFFFLFHSMNLSMLKPWLRHLRFVNCRTAEYWSQKWLFCIFSHQISFALSLSLSHQQHRVNSDDDIRDVLGYISTSYSAVITTIQEAFWIPDGSDSGLRWSLGCQSPSQ